MGKKVLLTMLVLFLLLCAAAGGLFLYRPTTVDAQRQTSEAELLELLESGQTVIKDFSPPAVEGEELEFGELESSASDPVDETAPMEITGYGVIYIPAIDLKMPLVEGADSYSLRAAAGWLPTSAEMGRAGNCVIFGHRMQTYGRHFNRLGEVQVGDEIKLYSMDETCYTYTVTGTETISPNVLMDTLGSHNEGFCLTLLTSTPTGVGSHRL